MLIAGLCSVNHFDCCSAALRPPKKAAWRDLCLPVWTIVKSGGKLRRISMYLNTPSSQDQVFFLHCTCCPRTPFPAGMTSTKLYVYNVYVSRYCHISGHSGHTIYNWKISLYKYLSAYFPLHPFLCNTTFMAHNITVMACVEGIDVIPNHQGFMKIGSVFHKFEMFLS